MLNTFNNETHDFYDIFNKNKFPYSDGKIACISLTVIPFFIASLFLKFVVYMTAFTDVPTDDSLVSYLHLQNIYIDESYRTTKTFLPVMIVDCITIFFFLVSLLFIGKAMIDYYIYDTSARKTDTYLSFRQSIQAFLSDILGYNTSMSWRKAELYVEDIFNKYPCYIPMSVYFRLSVRQFKWTWIAGIIAICHLSFLYYQLEKMDDQILSDMINNKIVTQIEIDRALTSCKKSKVIRMVFRKLNEDITAGSNDRIVYAPYFHKFMRYGDFISITKKKISQKIFDISVNKEVIQK